jgi:hypothetical protein
MPEKKTCTELLNIDLDLINRINLNDLLKSFGKNVVTLTRTDIFASVELASQFTTIDEIISRYAELVFSLGEGPTTLWQQCELRKFSIGIQGAMTPREKNFPISSKSISLISKMNADIDITIYSTGG